MNDQPDVKDLIDADIDGTASPSERALLTEALAKDAAAREEHRRLQKVRDMLAAVQPEVPPAQLSSRIMRAVRADRTSQRGKSGSKLLSFWPGGRVAIPYAYAAAAGAAIGILGYHVLTGSGSFGPAIAERDAVASISPAINGNVRVELVGTGARGSAALRPQGEGFALEVSLPAGAQFNVNLGYDPHSLEFRGISNPTGGIERVDVADGSVRWSQGGSRKVSVLFVPRSAGGSKVDIGFVGEAGSSGAGALQIPGR